MFVHLKVSILHDVRIMACLKACMKILLHDSGAWYARKSSFRMFSCSGISESWYIERFSCPWHVLKHAIFMPWYVLKLYGRRLLSSDLSESLYFIWFSCSFACIVTDSRALVCSKVVCCVIVGFGQVWEWVFRIFSRPWFHIPSNWCSCLGIV